MDPESSRVSITYVSRRARSDQREPNSILKH